MPIIPKDDVSLHMIQALKDATIKELTRRAIVENGGSPRDYVIREIFVGDDSSNAAIGNGFQDLGIRTEQTDNGVHWAQDASDLTADDDSSILTAGEEVDDKLWLGFFGVGDLNAQPGELVGLATGTGLMPPVGALNAVRFRTGARTKDRWTTDMLYNYTDAVGFSFDVDVVGRLIPRPVVYSENDKIDIQMNFSEDSLDKFICLRGYALEPWGEAISPTEWSRPPEGSTKPAMMSVEPAAELTQAQKMSIMTGAMKTIYEMGSVKFTRESLISRPFQITDGGANLTDTGIDDFQNLTDAVTGAEYFIQDSGDKTAMKLSSVVSTSTPRAKDGKWHTIYGFADRTANPDLFSMALLQGPSNRVGIYQVEHCYLYQDNPAGYFPTPHMIPENTSFDWQVAHINSRDAFVMLNGYTVEPKGDVIA